MATITKLYNANAAINVSSGGDNIAIAGVANRVIEVRALALTFASAVDVTLKDGSTVLGTYLGVTGISMDELPRQKHRFLTTEGNDFVINLSSAVACKGTVWFDQR